MLYPQIKAEAGSPDLRRPPPFHFKFLASHDPAAAPPTPLYRFGSSHPGPASPAMSYSDEYDDLALHPFLDHLPAPAADRAVRRRSSKGPRPARPSLIPRSSPPLACDQCRKSKCKCERSSALEPCKSCIVLGTRASPSPLLCVPRLIATQPAPSSAPPESAGPPRAT
jgi:hypothetical protein